jgi:single-stranded-DNA-specific exonuclease
MKQPHARRWSLHESDPVAVAALIDGLKVDPLIAGLLVNRGICDLDAARRFMTPSLSCMRDPFLLRGMERAVDRLANAFQAGERVCVYGDYDVDGITATALLIGFFTEVGVDCFYHIPHRMEDGYGLSEEGLRTVAGRGARVVVSVDCGITACREALVCRELGMDLIVTDHHTPGDSIPDAWAIINPLQPECTFPFKRPAGVGLAFYLLVALRARLRQLGWFDGCHEPDLKSSLELVALGTVADIVPLVDDNRAFVSHGLRELTVSRRPGIRALKEVSGLSGSVGCGDVGFRLAPRLNAAGRLDNATRGVELLLCGDRERAKILAEELDAANAERQVIERDMLQDAMTSVAALPDMSRRASIVLASEEWHAGVIGIVASRLVEQYHVPTVLIALQDEAGKGSARSIPRFDLYDALCRCAPLLQKFGGHKYAAGLSVDPAMVQEFADLFETVAADRLTDEDLIPELFLDIELPPSSATLECAEAVQELGPFGAGNPEPVFLLQNLRVMEKRVLKEKHLKLRLMAGGMSFEAIGFNLAERAPMPDEIDCACSLQINVWNGRRSLQLRLRDYRARF